MTAWEASSDQQHDDWSFVVTWPWRSSVTGWVAIFVNKREMSIASLFADCLIWLCGALILLTNAHAGYGRPTLKFLERFWLGSVRLASKAMKIAANRTMNLSKDFSMNWMPLRRCGKVYVRSVIEKLLQGGWRTSRRVKHENLNAHGEAATRSLKQMVELVDVKVVCIVLVCLVFSNTSKDAEDLMSVTQNGIICVSFCAFKIGVSSFLELAGKMLSLLRNVTGEEEVTINEEIMAKEENMVEEQVEVGRSRFDQFHCVCREAFAKGSRIRRRSREPSRVPINDLSRVLKKSRTKRRFVRMYISKNIPKSSKVHHYTRVYNVHRATGVRERTCKRSNKRRSRTKRRKRGTLNFKRKTAKVKRGKVGPHYGIGMDAEFKDCNHRIHYCTSSLSTDIETNPGPALIVDPDKTIMGPFSQGNVAVFGRNAGQQCVAMSLSALIFNHTNFICLSEDLIEIMNAGDNLYTTISQSTGQNFLLLTELPRMIRMFENQYELHYSESYTGRLFGNLPSIEGFPYCVTLTEAFNSLLVQNFMSFILTIGCNAVAVFCLSHDTFKVFDSHSRDSFGMEHPNGKCVLIEIHTVRNLVEYFQALHGHSPDLTFEMKGIQITISTSIESTNNRHSVGFIEQNSAAEMVCICKQCCATSFYSICFSAIQSPGYWNSDTLDTIIERGNAFERKMNTEKHLAINDLPSKVNICNVDVDITFNSKGEGVLTRKTTSSKQNLHELILNNRNTTGFLLWVSTYYLSCIIQQKARGNTTFYTLAFENESMLCFHKVDDIGSLIDKIFSTILDQFRCDEVHYQIQFLSCSSRTLTKSERRKVLKTHISSKKKEKILREKRGHMKKEYTNMEPAYKKRHLNNMSEKYKSMNLQKKTDTHIYKC